MRSLVFLSKPVKAAAAGSERNMPTMRVSYDPEADWVYISTGDWSGAGFSIEPVEQDILSVPASLPKPIRGIINIGKTRGWYTSVSPKGTFKISFPKANPLENWGLEFLGFSRICEFLKMEEVERLFGPEVDSQVRELAAEAAPYRESVGDQLAKVRMRGPVSLEEGFAQMERSRRPDVEIPAPDREVTSARQKLLQEATYDSGRYIVPRSLLIQE